MLAAEDVQRQITVTVVIAVKEAPLLMAMQRQIRYVQIQYDAFGSLAVRLDKDLHQQGIQRFRLTLDLLVTVRFFAAQLQPVQGAFTR
jgi:hypothetical protein